MLYKKLNYLAWLLIISYLLVIISMDISSIGFSFEGTIITLPLVVLILLFIQKNGYLINLKNTDLTKKEIFLRDYFYINYSFILAGFLSLLFQYNTSDAKAWWPFFIYLNFFYSVVFSLSFAYTSKLLKEHKTHTILFSIITLFTITLSKYWYHYLDTFYLDGYFIGLIAIFLLHLLVCIIFKLTPTY